MVPRASTPPPTTPVASPQLPPSRYQDPQSEDDKLQHSPPRSGSRKMTTDTATASLSLPDSQVSLLSLTSRNRSPYKRSHMRSHSSTSAVPAPSMTRASSSPGPEPSRSLLSTMPRPASPLGPPHNGRRFSPLRRSLEETRPTISGQGSFEDAVIPEDAELELPPRPTTSDASGSDFKTLGPTSYSPNTFPRLGGSSRRRPSSPLHQFTSNSATTSQHALRTSTSTPALSGTFNESYPSSVISGGSSMPSTPSSFRSRSPSISSLETIPDSPDAEHEAEQIAKLSKAAFDREKELSGEGGGSSGEEEVDSVGRRRGRGRGRKGIGGGTGKEERKRWSVCGAERRGDLDLETIWED